MTLAPGFLQAIALRRTSLAAWLEIEGVGYALATRVVPGLDALGRRGCLPVLIGFPDGPEAEIDPLSGDCSIGELTARIEDDPEGVALSLLANTARQDGWSYVGAPAWKPSFAYVAGDVVRPFAMGGTAADKYFTCVQGGTSGSSEPTWNSGNVNDGTVIWADAGARAIPASTVVSTNAELVTFAYSGPAPWVLEGDDFYIGRETFTDYLHEHHSRAGYEGGWVSAYRARYPAGAAFSDRVAPEHLEGDVISTYPRFLATRKVALLVASQDPILNPLNPNPATTARFVRWSGYVVDARAIPDGTGFEIVMQSVESKLRVQRFATQIRGKLVGPVAAGDGSYDGDVRPPANVLTLEASSVQGRDWVEGEVVHLRVGDEIVCGRLKADGTFRVMMDAPSVSQPDARGVFGTSAVQHDAGEEVRECLVLAGRNTSAGAEYWTPFTQGGHPLDIVLSLLLSVEGDGANGDYDSLPHGIGVGLTRGEVDVAGIQGLRDAWLPSALHVQVLDEPFTAKQLIASILRPHGCYLVPRLNNLLSIGRLNPPMPGSALRTIDASAILKPPSWDSGIREVYGRVVMQCDFDLVAGEYRQKYRAEIVGPGAEAQEFYTGLFRDHEVQAPGMWSGNVLGASSFGARISTGADQAFLRLLDVVMQRYARPMPVIVAECSYDAIDVEIADIILLTATNLPDPSAGTRGLVAEECIVVKKQPADGEGKVFLTVQPVPSDGQGRFIGPSALVSQAGSSVSTITVSAREFTDPVGVTYDARCFPVGARVEIRSSTLATLRATRTISGVTNTTISFGDGTATVSVGDVVLLAPYSDASQPAAVKARYAFLADSAGLLGSDAAHRYVS